MNTKYTDDLTWGDKIAESERYVPICHNCMEHTDERYNKELCQKCFDKGIVPSTQEYMDNGPFIPPRCSECLHNNPDWITIAGDGTDQYEIWMACVWCGYPTMKD